MGLPVPKSRISSIGAGKTIVEELVLPISVGPPVALAVYCGWLKRDSSATIKIVGLCVALSAAILGAWLGFHAPGNPLLGLITASIGAVAAANLGLIVLDLAEIGERPETIPSTAIPSAEH